MNTARRHAFFQGLAEAMPDPRSELEFATPYELLVAVILSAQATDRSVNLATRTLFPVARTPAAMVALGEEALAGHIRTIGLFRGKAKNVVLNVAFGEPTIAVDTHVFRVGNRTGLAPGKDPLAVELKLLKVTPPEFLLHAHHHLILHGRYTCLARKPRCASCPVYDPCGFKDKARYRVQPDA